MADDDSADRKTISPLQAATAWILGLAALIAAIVTLVNNSESLLAIFSRSKAPPEHSSGSPSPAPDSAVFSNGETVIRGTWSIDLDNGVTAVDQTDADLWWEQETNIERSLNPKNGALVALVGQRDFDSLTLQALKNLHYLSNDIRGNAIPTGTVLAYKTKHGRYGKFLIENYAYDLKVKWVTYRLE